MALSAGTRLGSYEIIELIGAGGMGEVYKARDPRLDRDVAVKVLPESVSRDKERLSRFEREARLLATFSHPNIAHIYGIEESAGVYALVMELVEGQTLDEVIRAAVDHAPSGSEARQAVGMGPHGRPRNAGGLPLEEALPIARQIADALEAAHAKHVIHRDLKPANIKLTADRAVKVLDFGLAKAMAGDEPESASAMNSPTLTAQATQAGIILGTAAYMSPEQARGKAADKRADIWAFGVILYEMLTGQPLFAGETVSDTLAAVLRQEIDWSRLPATMPQELRRLIRRCLERDRRNRLHDIADARIVLDEVANAGPQATPSPSDIRPRSILWPVAVAVVLAAGLGAFVGRSFSPAPTQPPARTVRMVVPTAPGSVLSQPAVSADGRFVVFAGGVGRRLQLYLHRFDQAEPQPIEKTEGGYLPFTSPDGRWIGFYRGNQIHKIAVDGGEPLSIAEASGGAGTAWLRDGQIVFCSGWLSGLSIVSSSGGAPRELTKVDAANGEKGHWYPHALPDGRHVLFTIWRAATGLNDAQVALLDVTTGKYQTLFAGADAYYLDPGLIVFFRAGSYHAVRFDVASRTVRGDPVRVLEDARGNLPEGTDLSVAVSATGAVAYVTGGSYWTGELAWVAAGGAIEKLPFASRTYANLSLTPDGRRAAAGVLEAGRYVLRVLDFDRRTDDALTLPGSSWRPAWHPDGRRLAFRTMRKGDFDAFFTDITTTAEAQPLVVTDADDTVHEWLPDGKSVIAEISTADGKYPLFKLTPGQAESRTLMADDMEAASVSPDGRWLAVTNIRSGREEVYVRPLFAEGVLERVSSQGGQAVTWSRKSRELYYARPPEILAVSYREENGRFIVTGERVWARVDGIDPGNIFSAAPDGRILLMLPENTTRQLRVVLGWDQEILSRLNR